MHGIRFTWLVEQFQMQEAWRKYFVWVVWVSCDELKPPPKFSSAWHLSNILPALITVFASRFINDLKCERNCKRLFLLDYQDCQGSVSGDVMNKMVSVLVLKPGSIA